MMGRPLVENFAEFIFKTDYEKLPWEVIYQAKRCLLDFLGVALAGSPVGLAPLITSVLYNVGGKEEATIIGDGRKIPAFHAALINGVKGHTLDMDDGHRYANGHPGVVVIPSAIALAEKESITGKGLIEAIVVGYEIFIRIAALINPSHLERGFHTTGTVGPFEAAAACSKILNLKKEEIKNALAIAGLQGAGLLEVMESGQMMKPLHPGKAAQAGVIASILAKEGAEGPISIFEGEKGFFKAFSDGVQWSGISNDLGSRFEIMNIYFKQYAACRHIHPALDAVKEIVNKSAVDTNDIRKIDVHTYSMAYQLTGQNREVKGEINAKFSLPVSIGLVLVHGKAGADEYDMEFLRDPMVQRLADKVNVFVDKERDDVYPRERGARVDILTSKRTYTCEIPLPKGDPENPLSTEEIKEKFLQNAKKVLTAEKARKVEKMVFDIEGQSARELMGIVW